MIVEFIDSDNYSGTGRVSSFARQRLLNLLSEAGYQFMENPFTKDSFRVRTPPRNDISSDPRPPGVYGIGIVTGQSPWPTDDRRDAVMVMTVETAIAEAEAERKRKLKPPSGIRQIEIPGYT